MGPNGSQITLVASGARGSNQTRIAFFPLGSLGAAGSHDADGPGLSRWAPLSLEALWAPFARLPLQTACPLRPQGPGRPRLALRAPLSLGANGAGLSLGATRALQTALAGGAGLARFPPFSPGTGRAGISHQATGTLGAERTHGSFDALQPTGTERPLRPFGTDFPFAALGPGRPRRTHRSRAADFAFFPLQPLGPHGACLALGADLSSWTALPRRPALALIAPWAHLAGRSGQTLRARLSLGSLGAGLTAGTRGPPQGIGNAVFVFIERYTSRIFRVCAHHDLEPVHIAILVCILAHFKRCPGGTRGPRWPGRPFAACCRRAFAHKTPLFIDHQTVADAQGAGVDILALDVTGVGCPLCP